ncbi:hypothetical protein OnM2_048080 [Erysiphe neolycopersici]|uniref:Uncharacterized protein n=1 Tax=Erysiphe neolycopersici TaxID=212602 RepID=A0A420HTI1_9PEZI|nr:hypothetical protein OnM2_048080 [Erysiphe neolycopersici]
MSDESQREEWTKKLVGKKIGDKHDDTTFDRADLPKLHRIIEPNRPMTFEYRPDRLTIYVTEEHVVTKVDFV